MHELVGPREGRAGRGSYRDRLEGSMGRRDNHNDNAKADRTVRDSVTLPSDQYLAETGVSPQPPNLKLRPAFTTLLVSLMLRIPPLLKVMSRLPKS